MTADQKAQLLFEFDQIREPDIPISKTHLKILISLKVKGKLSLNQIQKSRNSPNEIGKHLQYLFSEGFLTKSKKSIWTPKLNAFRVIPIYSLSEKGKKCLFDVLEGFLTDIEPVYSSCA